MNETLKNLIALTGPLQAFAVTAVRNPPAAPSVTPANPEKKAAPQVPIMAPSVRDNPETDPMQLIYKMYRMHDFHQRLFWIEMQPSYGSGKNEDRIITDKDELYQCCRTHFANVDVNKVVRVEIKGDDARKDFYFYQKDAKEGERLYATAATQRMERKGATGGLFWTLHVTDNDSEHANSIQMGYAQDGAKPEDVNSITTQLMPPNYKPYKEDYFVTTTYSGIQKKQLRPETHTLSAIRSQAETPPPKPPQGRTQGQ